MPSSPPRLPQPDLKPGPWSSLALFDRLTPKDAGARRSGRDIPFGPDSRQRFDLYAPRSGAAGLPLIVFFYGGGWDSGEKRYYSWVGRALAAQGFLVAIPDYRRVPEHIFPSFVEDGALAVAAARSAARELGADPDRVALAGHSAGAYIAAMLALDRGWLAGTGVPEQAVKAALGLAGPYDFYPFDVPASARAFGAAPEPLLTQPVRFARAAAPPLWLGHGGRDQTVRLRNSTALAEAVERAGGETDLRIYPELDHVGIILCLSLPLRARRPVLADMVAFIRERMRT